MRIFLLTFLFLFQTHNSNGMMAELLPHALPMVPQALFLCGTKTIPTTFSCWPSSNAQMVNMGISCGFEVMNFFLEHIARIYFSNNGLFASIHEFKKRPSIEDCEKNVFYTQLGTRALEISFLTFMHGCFLIANGNVKNIKHWESTFAYLLCAQIIPYAILMKYNHLKNTKTN